MSIQFSQPTYFALLFTLVPTVAYAIMRTKVMLRILGDYSLQNKKKLRDLRTKIFFRIIAWALAWACVCIALTGPSWGTQLVPVQRSGRAVSFVFDISYSMNAKDTHSGKISRLESSQQFTQELLSVLPGVAASAVLAKGDGILAVPLTEDYYAISNLVNSLSPNMLSHPGSSISRGVYEAINSFPPQSARSSYIIVLSDGDDTDDTLAASVEEAIKFGIHVIFVGFGSHEEIEVLAGDGTTKVNTALRAEKLQNIARQDNVDFIFADDSSAIEDIVNIIKPSIFYADSATTTGYESAAIKRHVLFISFAIVLFILGLLVYSFSLKKLIGFFMRNTKKVPLIIFLCTTVLFSGCSDWLGDAKIVLEGSYQWTQQDYQKAVASFLEVSTKAQETENIEILQYGLFGLSSTYIMQGETEASLSKINEMNPVVSPSLDFARWYNKGIIFHRNGEYDTAAFCFKKALLVDSSNIYAKMNLELCLKEETVQAQQGIQERIPVQEQKDSPGAADAVFSLIRESEENQWKNQQATNEESDIIDY